MNMLHTRDEYFAEHGHDCMPSVSTIALILGGYYFCSNGCVLALFDSEHARHRSLRGPGMRVRRYRAIPGPAPPPPGRPGPPGRLGPRSSRRRTTRHPARPGPSPQQFDAMKSMPVMRTRSCSGSNGRSESVSTTDCFGPWLLSNRFGDSEGTGTAGGVAAHNLTP